MKKKKQQNRVNGEKFVVDFKNRREIQQTMECTVKQYMYIIVALQRMTGV